MQTPFHKVLIANRGEIAMRILRAVRARGLQSVAVYSEADAHSPVVVQADWAVSIGAAPPAESYLRIDALIAAARATGADAVHPGYGFLAENAEFAQACRDAGLVFIGPSPEAIRAMGDKALAKARVAAAGVPCIPGYQGEDQSDARLQAEADRLGYPVMIKAVAGGGGRGMRQVTRREDFVEALHAAQREAQHAFGDASVLLERALVRPRHVEIQVFADRHGRVVHLGERDCSVQRRHQKLIEESPSPAVDAALRERMGATAVAAARAIGYEGAGTLEYLLDTDGAFYFMEMNTRLQVEHPVTEAVTGIDLVDWQLRVAAGEPLPQTQADIAWQGHAIEVRLCAEDAEQDFLPQSGTLWRWLPPAHLRVEHALANGAVIPPNYDSMLAKLIAHGPNREVARTRLLKGLQELVALGVTTNQHFLQLALTHPVFVQGEATTDFVHTHAPSLTAAPPTGLLAVAAWLAHATAGRSHPGSVSRLQPRWPINLVLDVHGELHALRLTPGEDGAYAVEDSQGSRHSLQSVSRQDGEAAWIQDGVRECAHYARHGDWLWLHWHGRAWTIRDLTRAPAQASEQAGDGRLRAQTAGRVVALSAALGDAVEMGQRLVVLEAMKMEHVHVAATAGTIAALHVQVGAQVAQGALLVEIIPSDSK